MAEISSDEEELVATLMLMKDLKKSRKRKALFAWVRNLCKEREEKGAYNMLVREMKLGDREYYFRRIIELNIEYLPLLHKKSIFTFCMILI